jgi:dephospho-CoA kinase
MIVGVTGGYCAGKDAVVTLFAEEGFHVVDVDGIGHQVLEENRERIVRAFGTGILSPQGGIDRCALGEIVFRSSRQRKKLESIVHPQMVRRVEAIVRQKKERVVINAAILFKMGLHKLCDTVICVSAPLLVRLKRAKTRDSLSIWQALRRFLAQPRICPKSNGRDVDIYFVRNWGDRESLKEKVRRFLRQKYRAGNNPEE